MKNNYPWYDSQWLNSYVQAKSIIKQHNPALLEEFVNTTNLLRTRSDFQVTKLPNVFNEVTLAETRELIEVLQTDELEKQELFQFGRMVVHDHPYLNRLQKIFTDLVSEIAQEPVEPYYNFLSLYNNLGVCGVHMDAPYAKWTLDICIDQSESWPIYFSSVQPWPESFKHSGNDWETRIKDDPENNFSKYNLEIGEGVVFSGSSQWHYRNRILNERKNNYCHLAFFHFIPKGAQRIVDPSQWASLFGVPELAQITDGKSETTAYTVSEIFNKQPN